MVLLGKVWSFNNRTGILWKFIRNVKLQAVGHNLGISLREIQNWSHEACLGDCKTSRSTFKGFCFLKSSPEDMLIDFTERGREGEAEAEKHWYQRETSNSCLSHAPWPETKPIIQARDLTRNWTLDLPVYGTDAPTNWATLARAPSKGFKQGSFYNLFCFFF